GGRGPAKNPAATADMENANAIEERRVVGIATELTARRVPDIGEPDRIELMQHRHFSAGVPPLSGKPGEAADLGGVDGGVGKGVWMYRFVGHVNDSASSCSREDRARCGTVISPLCIPGISPSPYPPLRVG